MPAYSTDDLFLATIDGRTKAGRLLKQARQALVEQLGGKVTGMQHVLIERAAMLQLRLAMLDELVLGDGLTIEQAKSYGSAERSLIATLTMLGIGRPPSRYEPPKAPAKDAPPTLADLFANRP